MISNLHMSDAGYLSLRLSDNSVAPLPNGVYQCLLCAKPFLMGVFLGEPDQVCPECMVAFEEYAKVVCATCPGHVTIARLKPGRVAECDYEIRKRSVLHSDGCNICRPGLKESVIIEIRTFIDHHRRGKLYIPVGFVDHKRR